MYNGPSGKLWPHWLYLWPSFEQVISAEVFSFCFPLHISFVQIWLVQETPFPSTEHEYKENQIKKFLILVLIFTHNPKYNNFTIISLVLGGGVVHFEDSSFKSPFFFPQHVTVEGECVTARLENASLTVLKFLLTQTARPSVRTLSWKHQ